MASIKKPFSGKNIIIGVSLILLNIVGISYAHWSEQLEITSSITSGKADAIFCKDYNLEVIRGNGSLTAARQKDEYDKWTIMDVSGKVEPGYKAFLHYCVINTGTVPFVFDDQHIKLDNGIVLQLSQKSGILDPQQRFYSETGNPQLDITVPHNLANGFYPFEMVLNFRQKTD